MEKIVSGLLGHIKPRNEIVKSRTTYENFVNEICQNRGLFTS